MSEEQHGKLETIRHSMAHVMAEAVLQMFPQAKIAIGPAIENGFYYDFDLPRALNPEDLETISEGMKAIIKKQIPFVKSLITREEALERFTDQPYKVELINGFSADEEISLYNQGGFTDLCRGPHVESTAKLNSQPLNSFPSPALTGGGMKNAPCFSAFMEPPGLPLRNSGPT